MIKEARGFGNSINEAQEDARIKLGAKADDNVQFETVTMYKKKVLGVFGGSKAEVRAFIELPDSKPKNAKKAVAKPADKDKKAEPAQKPAKETTENKTENKNKKQEEKKPEAKQTEAVKSAEAEYGPLADSSEIPADSSAGKAIAYLKNILDKLGCANVTVKAAVKENSALIVLDGDDLGVIIGRRGETLDSLQYLASLAANCGNGYYKISLNIGNYREKREQTLIALANRVARQVQSTGRSRALEPMNPYERRIIHTAIQEINGVESNSIGEGSNRRVVISSTNGESRPQKRNGKGRGNREQKPSNTVSSVPTREPKKDSDIPLYGKIERAAEENPEQN